MFDYSQVTDVESFRAENLTGYYEEFNRCVFSWPDSYPIVVTGLVEFLLKQTDKAAIKKLLEELRFTVDGPEPDKIDFAVYQNSTLTPLAKWVSTSGLSADESVFLHQKFRFVLTDIMESFDLDESEVIEKVLPYYNGTLHAWLDKSEVRVGFPGASKRKQNYYAHHMLDFFTNDFIKNRDQMSENEVRAREILLSRRKHVVRHVLVAKDQTELKAPPSQQPIFDPYSFVEAELDRVLDEVMKKAMDPSLNSAGDPSPIREFSAFIGPRLSQVLKLEEIKMKIQDLESIVGALTVQSAIDKVQIAQAFSW